MHPIDSEIRARLIMDDRHREAARQRRPRHLQKPSLHVRLGTVLVTLGRALQRGRWHAADNPTGETRSPGCEATGALRVT